jgi:hypothetical protein
MYRYYAITLRLLTPTDGFADLNWMTRSQITPHSARPEHENGSRAAFFRKPFMK